MADAAVLLANDPRTRIADVNLPAHYAIDGMCAACRGASKSGDDRYRVGTHAW